MSGYWQPCDVSEPYARGDQDLARDVNTAGARAGDRLLAVGMLYVVAAPLARPGVSSPLAGLLLGAHTSAELSLRREGEYSPVVSLHRAVIQSSDFAKKAPLSS